MTLTRMPAIHSSQTSAADLARLGRTVAHLRPAQAGHRARLRAQQAAQRRFPAASRRFLAGPDPAAAVGWPESFRPVDALTPGYWPAAAELAAGKIRLLGQARGLDDGWQHTDAPRLWRFHLHYWDWAWGLAAGGDLPAARGTFARLWRSWQDATGASSDAWHPYPAALRAWSWCGLHRELVAGTGTETAFVTALAAHAGFLRRHLEYDVGGNHLIKGLKALAGLAVFFADEALLERVVTRLAREVSRQVLPDGGHYERAPAYHCQVLTDLADVAGLLAASGRVPHAAITGAADAMRGWLGAVLTPDGQVPLLNDGYPVDRTLLAALRPGPPPAAPLVVLPATGLVRASAGRWHLLADVGPPCPAELPAHAHADTFGCLVHVDGVPLLTETGTSTYEPGPTRDWERSTAAHNTAEVAGANSTEVWGAFRAGRRARVSGLTAQAGADGLTCEAVHDGYRYLPGRPRHRRRWALTEDGLRVDDELTGGRRHPVVIRWHLAAGSSVRLAASSALISGPAGIFAATVAATGPVALTVETRPAAAGFGSTADAPVLTCRLSLPAAVTTTWTRKET